MCGILAISWFSNVAPSRDRLIRMLRDSADRGQDSTGVVVVTQDGQLVVHREVGDVDRWINSVPDSFWDAYDNMDFLLGVTRAQPVPEGDSLRVENRQPIQWGDWIAVHNGTIGNDREIKKKYGFRTKTQIDTEVAIALLDREYIRHSTLEEAVQVWASKLSGGMAIVAYNTETNDIVVIKNFKPLCVARTSYGTFWASERKTLEVGGLKDIRWIPPYTGFAGGDFFKVDTLHETDLPVGDPNKALVVTSGGIDSTTAAYIAKKLHHCEPTLLHFNYGQIAAEREWESVCYAAEDLCCNKMQVDISWMGKLADTPLVSTNANLPLGIKSVETVGCWVPARNLIMLSIAAGIAESLGIGCIYSGFNLEEAGCYPDNDVEFLKVFNLALQYGTLRRPRLVLALERIMKPEIIKLGDYLGVDFSRTWSCDRGEKKPCGQCGCCWMRQFAFRRAKIEDKQTYLRLPLENPPWARDKYISEVAPLDDILNRVRQTGLDDLITI